jgi:hypothetical protein
VVSALRLAWSDVAIKLCALRGTMFNTHALCGPCGIRSMGDADRGCVCQLYVGIGYGFSRRYPMGRQIAAVDSALCGPFRVPQCMDSSGILTTSVSSFLASIVTLMASTDTFMAINSLSRPLVTLSGPLQAISGPL